MFWFTSVFELKVKLLICDIQAPIAHRSICYTNNNNNNNSMFEMIWQLYYPQTLQRCCLGQWDGKEREGGGGERRERRGEEGEEGERGEGRGGREEEGGDRALNDWLFSYTFVVWLKRPWFICTTHNIITPCTVSLSVCVCVCVCVCVWQCECVCNLKVYWIEC